MIDFIKRIFFKLCGLDTVLIDGKESDLVSSLIQSNTIHRVFLTIMLIGVILLTIFVIIALIRVNYQGNERKTRGAIISKAGQSFLIFLLIPFLLLAGMSLVNVIMASINTSMQQYVTEGQTLIGGQMLITTGNNAFIGSAGERETIERMFLTGELDYTKLSVVRQYNRRVSMRERLTVKSLRRSSGIRLTASSTSAVSATKSTKVISRPTAYISDLRQRNRTARP